LLSGVGFLIEHSHDLRFVGIKLTASGRGFAPGIRLIHPLLDRFWIERK